MTLHEEIKALCQGAKDASFKIGLATESERNNLLTKIAEAIKAGKDEIIEANKIDLKNAKENGISDAMLDRLMLNEARIDAIADAILERDTVENLRAKSLELCKKFPLYKDM